MKSGILNTPLFRNKPLNYTDYQIAMSSKVRENPLYTPISIPKSTERPAFQTYNEITLQIEQDDLTQEQQNELWECLYLGTDEIEELIQYVREKALHTFLYPMIVAAAHSGARRSELMRSQLTDIRDDVLIIREKKRR